LSDGAEGYEAGYEPNEQESYQSTGDQATGSAAPGSAAPSYQARSREIARALIEIGGVGFRPTQPITFKSGIKSPVYCDNRRFPFWPQQWAKVIAGFAAMIAERGIDADVVGGVEAAGIPHSAALGFAMKRPSVFIRKEAKEHGTKKRVEGGDVSGRRVVLVEDLVTTGMSSLAAVDALRGEGAVVTDCVAIISYGFRDAMEMFADSGVRLHPATDFETVLPLAVQMGAVDEDGAGVVMDWLSDPRGWGKRFGFE
jgi:orotate phosphoribosyltransferase